jgi:hypothetical protein
VYKTRPSSLLSFHFPYAKNRWPKGLVKAGWYTLHRANFIEEHLTVCLGEKKKATNKRQGTEMEVTTVDHSSEAQT